MKNKIIALIVVLLVIIGVVTYVAIPRTASERFGGTTNLGSLTLSNQLSVGGIFATTTTSTLTQAQITDISTITTSPAAAAITITLPASSTLTTLIPNAGDQVQFVIANLATVAASSTTIAGGTGTTLKQASSTAAILGGGTGTLILVRLASTNVLAILDIQN